MAAVRPIARASCRRALVYGTPPLAGRKQPRGERELRGGGRVSALPSYALKAEDSIFVISGHGADSSARRPSGKGSVHLIRVGSPTPLSDKGLVKIYVSRLEGAQLKNLIAKTRWRVFSQRWRLFSQRWRLFSQRWRLFSQRWVLLRTKQWSNDSRFREVRR